MPETDKVLAGAVELAREALLTIAKADEVGDHLDFVLDDVRLGTHSFECLKAGYRGWRWVTTLARVPRGRKATICEVALIPGPDALLAPKWVPWKERLKPGDMRPGDTLPYQEQDERLEPGYTQVDQENRDALQIDEVGLGRKRVLSPEGRDQAAKRWYRSREHGPERARKKKGEQCSTCGFLMKLHGSMRTMFGVCANEWSPSDGRVVSLDHVCGAHSETDEDVAPTTVPKNQAALSDADLEVTAS